MTEPTDQRLLATMKQALTYHPLSVFPGRCYFALLPDGTIKIGYSNTVDLMHHRMKILSRQYGAEVQRVADLPGGFITEALMHERFAADRIPGTGERFRPSPELVSFIEALIANAPVMNAPVNTTSQYRELVGPEAQIFDVTNGQLPAGTVLVDHRDRPLGPLPPWLAEWDPSWRRTEIPLPDDIVTYVGPGRSAIHDLARFMRHAARPETNGQSRAEAVHELLALRVDGESRYRETTIRRAWRMLGMMDRILDINGEPSIGKCFWEARPSELKVTP